MSVLEAATMPPARSVSQRMEALAKANDRRIYRAGLKRRLKAREVGLFDVIDDSRCDTMRLRDVLMSLPGMGALKVDTTMHAAQVSPAKTCAGLTTQQRMRLARTLRERHPHMEIVFRGPEPSESGGGSGA